MLPIFFQTVAALPMAIYTLAGFKQTCLQIILVFWLIVPAGVFCNGQSVIVPGDNTLNASVLKPGTFTMGYYAMKDNKPVEICTYETKIALTNKEIHITTTLIFLQSNLKWKDDLVMDRGSFKPVSRSSERDSRSFKLRFSGSITGEYTNNESGKSKAISETITGAYFDIAMYPYVLKVLPLKAGYKAVIPVYDYDAVDKKKIYKVVVSNVRSGSFHSALTGLHDIWLVYVEEESTGDKYCYHIDKETRKLWRVDIVSKGNTVFLSDKETDYNPFKNPFNKEETLKLVSAGSATIAGEAFARDQAGSDNKKIDIGIVNFNKKQFAPKGTSILLMPYTAFFKEWLEFNSRQSRIKNGKQVPLPKEAAECILYSTVYDDKGSFEFTGLMPGEYLVFTAFGYEDSFRRIEETGRASVYADGHYVGTEVYSGVFGYSQAATANIKKLVTIKTAGETVKIKLKKT